MCVLRGELTRDSPSPLHSTRLGNRQKYRRCHWVRNGFPSFNMQPCIIQSFPRAQSAHGHKHGQKNLPNDFFSFPSRSRSQRMSFTLLVAQLLVLRPLASLVLVRVRVDRLVDRLRHFLLPALRDDQRKVLVQLLVAVQQLRTDGRRERKREREIN